tara:strand:- start:253 stop:675 length:423 start_codon:yes stop_codon:yes gene_type:complete
MIKYKLVCNKCKNIFDSWFASSKEFEKLKKKNFLSCINCNSKNVDKSLMAPLIIKKSKRSTKKYEKNKHIKNKLKEYKKFIINNFDYVGKNFAYEARIMHYDKKKSVKGIYGDATLDQINELKDEGIETEVVPWINDNEN